MNSRIVVLVDNTVTRTGLLAEHGWAVWVEAGGHSLLLDTGAGGVLWHNASKLKIRLRQADAVVLSHGHYDHTGALAGLLRSAWQKARLFAHPAAFAEKYSRARDGTPRQVGLADIGEPEIAERAELVRCLGPTEIGGGLHLTGPVPRHTDFEDTGGSFFLNRECTRPDELLDDQALFFDTTEGTCVVLGCAHAGVINTLDYIRELTSGRPIHTVIGGMHLVNAKAERLDQTVAGLRRIGVRRLIPSHCTGLPAIARLWQEFPGQCVPCTTGLSVS